MPEDLIDAVYEAALMTDRWPCLLDRLSAAAGGKGGLLAATCQDNVNWVTSPGIEGAYRAFLAGGWHLRTNRVQILASRRYPGFVTDLDLMSPEEIASDPVFTEFLIPNGFSTLAATIVPGLDDDSLLFTVEGLASPHAARAVIPMLDSLRPHLARAAMLAARLGLDVNRHPIGTPG